MCQERARCSCFGVESFECSFCSEVWHGLFNLELGQLAIHNLRGLNCIGRNCRRMLDFVCAIIDNEIIAIDI